MSDTEFPSETVIETRLRLLEAVLFAAPRPLSEDDLASRLPEGADIRALLAQLAEHYAPRGVHLVAVAGGWAFRTAPDLASVLARDIEAPKKLSRAAIEALAIIAYQQPVTRGEIEEIRGVALNKGTLDALLEANWIKPMGRRESPGRPMTWGTTPHFLEYFGLSGLDALPGVEELRAAGLLDRRPGITVLAMREEEVEDGEPDDRQPELL
jgi:segregation and condensation protein B